ncbi:hypothetical protein R1flu_022654 [Riccia fluitans]|uniref:Uncharacterized protein n=1 Tax=Riccia fluitans TaxID=41844 RepID=A0ABD1XPW7_9MARC
MAPMSRRACWKYGADSLPSGAKCWRRNSVDRASISSSRTEDERPAASTCLTLFTHGGTLGGEGGGEFGAPEQRADSLTASRTHRSLSSLSPSSVFVRSWPRSRVVRCLGCPTQLRTLAPSLLVLVCHIAELCLPRRFSDIDYFGVSVLTSLTSDCPLDGAIAGSIPSIRRGAVRLRCIGLPAHSICHDNLARALRPSPASLWIPSVTPGNY